MPDQDWRLVADVGGTNVRFARAVRKPEDTGGVGIELRDATTGPHGAFASFGECLAAYLRSLPLEAGKPGSVAIGAAGLVRDAGVQLTNAGWFIDRAEVAGIAGTGRVAIVNDLQAVARAIPELRWSDVTTLRSGGHSRPLREDEEALVLGGSAMTALAVNVGTGFGCSAVHRVSRAAMRGQAGPASAAGENAKDAWLSFASEAGHMTSGLLGSVEQDDEGAWKALAGSASSVEELLSGEGVARWASALAKRKGEGGRGFVSARDVFQGVDASEACRQTVLDVSRSLGACSRNLVLAHGAWDGVFLVGSVVKGWCEAEVAEKRSAFEAGFLTEGKMADAVAATPVHVITLAQPELIGLACLEIG